MLSALRNGIAKRFEVFAELIGLAFSLSGATLAAVLGKLLVAVILGAVTLGFFLRLTGRRTGAVVRTHATPLWARSVAALLAIVEVAMLVEATDLPVRFHQPGFAYRHWALVLAALVVAYLIQVQLLRRMVGKRDVQPAP